MTADGAGPAHEEGGSKVGTLALSAVAQQLDKEIEGEGGGGRVSNDMLDIFLEGSLCLGRKQVVVTGIEGEKFSSFWVQMEASSIENETF